MDFAGLPNSTGSHSVNGFRDVQLISSRCLQCHSHSGIPAVCFLHLVHHAGIFTSSGSWPASKAGNIRDTCMCHDRLKAARPQSMMHAGPRGRSCHVAKNLYSVLNHDTSFCKAYYQPACSNCIYWHGNSSTAGTIQPHSRVRT